jgi:mercuric ion transport protein
LIKSINSRAALAVSGVSAILASSCCLSPLVLLSLGISGAWISNLSLLESYRPVFLSAALVAIFFAGRSLWWPTQSCKPGKVCSTPKVKATYKLLFWGVAALVLIALMFPYIMPFFY